MAATDTPRNRFLLSEVRFAESYNKSLEVRKMWQEYEEEMKISKKEKRKRTREDHYRDSEYASKKINKLYPNENPLNSCRRKQYYTHDKDLSPPASSLKRTQCVKERDKRPHNHTDNQYNESNSNYNDVNGFQKDKSLHTKESRHKERNYNNNSKNTKENNKPITDVWEKERKKERKRKAKLQKKLFTTEATDDQWLPDLYYTKIKKKPCPYFRIVDVLKDVPISNTRSFRQ